MIGFSSKENLDNILISEAYDNAIINVIKVGRLLEIEDDAIAQLIEEFDRFSQACPTALGTLRDADIAAFQNKFISLPALAQNEIKERFKKSFAELGSEVNRYNLFADQLRRELFQNEIDEIDDSQLEYVAILSQIEESLITKIKSLRRRREIIEVVQQNLDDIEKNKEKTEYLQTLIEQLASLDETQIVKFFNLPWSITQLFKCLQDKIKALDIDERAIQLLITDLKKRVDGIPPLLQEENLSEKEMGTENWNAWQQDLHALNILNMPDSIVLRGFIKTAEKQAEELNRDIARINNIVRFDRSITDATAGTILTLLQTRSGWDEHASFDRQKASLNYQFRIWEEKDSTINTLDKFNEHLAQNPLKQNTQEPTISPYGPLPIPIVVVEDVPAKSRKIRMLTYIVSGSAMVACGLVLSGLLPAVGPLALLKGATEVYLGLNGLQAGIFLLSTTLGIGTLAGAFTETISRLVNRQRRVPVMKEPTSPVNTMPTLQAAQETTIDYVGVKPAAILPLLNNEKKANLIPTDDNTDKSEDLKKAKCNV